MYNVISWIKSFALASHGLSEQQISEVAKANTLPAFAESALGENVARRMIALSELQRNFRNMSSAELRETMTTAHFSQYFADALSRAFYKDYEYQMGSWLKYTTPDTAPDFRDIKRMRLTRPAGLQKRREKAEAKPTHREELTPVEFAVEEYARQFDVSWRTLMNDDLGEIARTPKLMADVSKQWLDSWVSGLYDNATLQAALVALGAPWSGTGRLTLPNLAIGLSAMMQRTDANAQQINFRRVHLVIPPILQIQAATILRDLLSFGGQNSNILGDFVASVQVDPYIATAGANVPWYLFADPNEASVVTVARLQGWPGPVVSQKASEHSVVSGSAPAQFLAGSFATGDIEFMVEDIVGGWDDASYVGVTDFRGLYYSSGTTP